MSIFSNKPYKTFNSINKHPALLGIPFVLLIVAASFGLQHLTQTRYELQALRVHEVSEEEHAKLKKNRKKIDLREEYFKLRAKGNEDWEPIRISRPDGLPEWGIPPEPPSEKSPEK